MINNFFRRTALKLAENGNIQEKYVELYIVAMQSALAMLLNGITTLVIGYLSGMWWYSVILLAAFMFLRSYAGGYHARGYVSCYLESCILLTAILLFMKYFILKRNLVSGLWFLFLASIVVIFLLAPLADENKPISEKETVVFKRRARILLILETMISAILAALQIDYCYAVMMAVVLSALMLLLHKCREIVILHKEKLNTW